MSGVQIGRAIYITISTFTSLSPYGVRRRRRPSVPSHFQVSSYSEFQMPSQTAAERDKAELCILDFKTTWSEFQKASQTAAERGKAELQLPSHETAVWAIYEAKSHFS